MLNHSTNALWKRKNKYLSLCVAVGIKYVIRLKITSSDAWLWCFSRIPLSAIYYLPMVNISCRCSCSFLMGLSPLGPALIGCFSGDPQGLHRQLEYFVHPSTFMHSPEAGLVLSGGNTFLVSCTASGSWLQSIIWIQGIMNTLSGTYQSLVTFLSEAGVGTPESRAYNCTTLPSSQN